MTLPPTPSQTVGPFFHRGLLHSDQRRLVPDDGRAGRIRVEGTVLDGRREPVADALVEVWQANRHGRYRHPADTRDLPDESDFTGYGRTGTDESGRFWFVTVKPGPVPGSDGRTQAPHLIVQVFARGLLDVLTTRLYFADDAALEEDPVLQSVAAARRHTLVAQPSDHDGGTVYHLEIVLQGDRETVFFDVGGRRRTG